MDWYDELVVEHDSVEKAQEAVSHALAIYNEKKEAHFLFEFGECYHSVRVNKPFRVRCDELVAKANPGALEESFLSNARISRITNVLFSFCTVETDALTSRSYYWLEVTHNRGHVEKVKFTGPQLSNAQMFLTALLGKSSGGFFHGTDKDLRWLRNKWLG